MTASKFLEVTLPAVSTIDIVKAVHLSTQEELQFETE